MRNTREIAWLKGALRTFMMFPEEVRGDVTRALTFVAAGGMPDKAKPFRGVGNGVFEIALRHRGDAFRAVYAVQLADAVWVIDAFQKKSKRGIKTPQMDVDRIRDRLKRLKDMLDER